MLRNEEYLLPLIKNEGTVTLNCRLSTALKSLHHAKQALFQKPFGQ